MSSRAQSHRGRRGGASKRARGNPESRRTQNGSWDGHSKSHPAPIARSPERPPPAPTDHDKSVNLVEWPEEHEDIPETSGFSDPAMPSDLVGVIGYCSEKSIGDVPGTLVTPTDVHKSVKDAKNYLFGAELETAMRKSLEEYTKVFN